MLSEFRSVEGDARSMAVWLPPPRTTGERKERILLKAMIDTNEIK